MPIATASAPSSTETAGLPPLRIASRNAMCSMNGEP
jgi:hypothetical protein